MIDSLSPTWKGVQTWADQQLESDREKLESVTRDEIKTAILRGRVQVLRELLKLPKASI